MIIKLILRVVSKAYYLSKSSVGVNHYFCYGLSKILVSTTKQPLSLIYHYTVQFLFLPSGSEPNLLSIDSNKLPFVHQRHIRSGTLLEQLIAVCIRLHEWIKWCARLRVCAVHTESRHLSAPHWLVYWYTTYLFNYEYS